MYPISTEVLSLFKQNYRQVVNITVRGKNKTFELTEANIIQGGFSIDRYCISGNKIEIGSAVAAELTINLDNRDDKFAAEQFEGAELEVKLGIKKWDAHQWENAQLHWIPCGFFTVDEPPRKLSTIRLTALDKMVLFDVEVNPDDLTFPTTVSALLSKCCQICGVKLATDRGSLINSQYVISSYPTEDTITYRQLIQWIAEITATCAYIDWNGELRLEWFTDNITDTTITPSDRYSSDLYEQNITITGVQITDEDDNVYLAGTDDYAFNIDTNGLIQDDKQSVAEAIFQQVGGFTYRPYTCTVKPMPHVYPLDTITYIDKHGTEHTAIITNVLFRMNLKTTVSGKGETNVKNGYATANPLTKGESIVLKKLESRVNAKITNSQQAALDMNEVMSNSLGLYRTSVTEENGSVSYYYHDKATLASSSIIYTFKSGGFAWTNKWDAEETVWHYGITKDGNAVLNMLSVYKLTADYIDASELHVSAANIDGTLTAKQIDASELHVSAANIDGKLTAEQIEAVKVVVDAADITGQLTSSQIKAGAITTDKIAVGAIGGFTITSSHIQHGGKTSYNDSKSGVFISPDGIGLGAGKLYMTAAGKFHAEEAEIVGHITATSGQIGCWYIGADGFIHAQTGVYGTYSWSTTGTNLITASGYAFVALTTTGIQYVLKNGSDYDNSATIVVTDSLITSSGGTVTPGGGTIYL